MKSLRPLAGALLAILMIATAAPAAEVELILPGGGGDTKITETGPVDTVPRDETRAKREARDRSEPVLQTRHFGSQVELSCAVGDRPNAIIVINHSSEPLPPGTRIKWQLKADGLQGFFRLLGPLEGGATLVADNVLDGRASNGGNCVARVI